MNDELTGSEEEKKPDPGLYEMQIRVLGNEIFAIGFKTSDNSNRAIVQGTIAVFVFLIIVLGFADQIASFYHFLMG